MADKENQHFVPQYHFRFFSPNGKSISLLNTASGKAIKTASIKGQASKSYFYGDAKVEDLITQIETSFIDSLKKIKTEKTFSALTEEQTVSVLQAMMFQRSRTLAKRKDGAPQHEYMMRAMAEIAINTNDSIDEKTKQDLRNCIDYMQPNPIPFQGLEMTLSVTQAYYLLDLEKIVIKNRTKTPFIFSDAPSILINPMQRKVETRGVLGMKTPGIIAILPLGPRIAVMLADKNAYKIKGLNNGSLSIKSTSDIDELNKLQVLNAFASVYFDDHSHSTYVYSLWNKTKKHLNNSPKGVVQEGILLDNETEKEIVHFFEKQLPITPKLSFLEYDEVSEYSHLMDRDYWDGRKYF